MAAWILVRLASSVVVPRRWWSGFRYYRRMNRMTREPGLVDIIDPKLKERYEIKVFGSTFYPYRNIVKYQISLKPDEPIDTGRDYQHWAIFMEKHLQLITQQQKLHTFVKTLASVVGSEEEAKKKIYSIHTKPFIGFGCLISKELADKVEGLPGVLLVLPDKYDDIPNKDYGGDLFVDGEVVHRPQKSRCAESRIWTRQWPICQ